MHSGSFMYQFVLVPLSIFGTVSVCIAFVLLLPGVGQALAAGWTVLTGLWVWERRKESSTPPSGA